MAGGAQGSGGRPAVNPQGQQQFQTALQGYRQAQAGMPSQVPGANAAAPAVMPAPQGQGQMFNPGMPPQISQPMPQGGIPQNEPQRTMPAYAGPAPAPQMPPQYGSTNPTQLDPSMMAAIYQQALGQQGQGMARPAVMPQAPQGQAPISVGASQPYAGPQGQAQPMPRPMPQDARFQQNPSMTPRPMPRPMPQGRPEVQGNPNAMPVTRGRVR